MLIPREPVLDKPLALTVLVEAAVEATKAIILNNLELKCRARCLTCDRCVVCGYGICANTTDSS